MDRAATNFDLDADESCIDCCTYPSLKIQFENKWQFPDTFSIFSTDSVFHDALDQPFKIERIRFYWSDYRLEMAGGIQIPTSDLIEIKILDGSDTTSVEITDHFLLANITSAKNNLTLGTLQADGVMYGLNANFGFDRPDNGALTTEVPNTHPLAPQLDNMNYGSHTGFIFAKIELHRDTITTDTVTVNIHGDNALRSLYLPLPVPVILTEGFNPLLVIETDISKWFEGINVRTSDTTSLQTQILNNIPESFTLKEVYAN